MLIHKVSRFCRKLSGWNQWQCLYYEQKLKSSLFVHTQRKCNQKITKNFAKSPRISTLLQEIDVCIMVITEDIRQKVEKIPPFQHM